MSTDDLQDRTAKTLLDERKWIWAKAHGKTSVEGATDLYGSAGLDATEAALDTPTSNSPMTSWRRSAATTTVTDDAAGGDGLTAKGGDGGGVDTPGHIMSAGEYVEKRRRKRERLEADDVDADLDTDDIALQAMDGADWVAANDQGLSPTEYLQAGFGLMAADFDIPDALHDAILDQLED